jgi:hypothetical protein
MSKTITIRIQVDLEEVNPKKAIKQIQEVITEGLNSFEKNMAKLEAPVLTQPKEFKKFCVHTIQAPNMLVIESELKNL